jgi:hypothetical protein
MSDTLTGETVEATPQRRDERAGIRVTGPMWWIAAATSFRP